MYMIDLFPRTEVCLNMYLNKIVDATAPIGVGDAEDSRFAARWHCFYRFRKIRKFESM